MALGERYSLSMNGILCGAPVANTYTYEQIQPDLPGVKGGAALVEGWFVKAGGPWLTIRARLTNGLQWLCAAYASSSEKGAILLNGATGNSNEEAMPSTVSVMLHLWAIGPHPKHFAGRVFVPGMLRADQKRSSLQTAATIAYGNFGAALININPTGAAGTMFRLVPNEKMIPNPIGGIDATNFVGKVFVDPLLRRIGSRKPDLCQSFAAVGAAPGQPGLVVPANPT